MTRLRQQESARRSVEAEALAASLNRQERALARLKVSGPLLGTECIDEADYRARQAAVDAAMDAAVERFNPRNWK